LSEDRAVNPTDSPRWNRRSTFFAVFDVRNGDLAIFREFHGYGFVLQGAILLRVMISQIGFADLR
jgi:hypothetical protein